MFHTVGTQNATRLVYVQLMRTATDDDLGHLQPTRRAPVDRYCRSDAMDTFSHRSCFTALEASGGCVKDCSYGLGVMLVMLNETMYSVAY